MSHNPYDALSDEALDDIGMYRCACGASHYPTGDPDDQHCELDVPTHTAQG